MRVMVSLNLADIMTATRRATPPRETPNNEGDPPEHNQESQLTNNCENTTELIE